MELGRATEDRIEKELELETLQREKQGSEVIAKKQEEVREARRMEQQLINAVAVSAQVHSAAKEALKLPPAELFSREEDVRKELETVSADRLRREAEFERLKNDKDALPSDLVSKQFSLNAVKQRERFLYPLSFFFLHWWHNNGRKILFFWRSGVEDTDI